MYDQIGCMYIKTSAANVTASSFFLYFLEGDEGHNAQVITKVIPVLVIKRYSIC